METIRELLSFLVSGHALATLVAWPPDVFACAATLLERSGGYVRVVHDWPPPEYRDCERWEEEMEELGEAWRRQVGAGTPVPLLIQENWNAVLRGADLPVRSLGATEGPGADLARRLIILLVAADEASFGVGLPRAPKEEIDEFDRLATDQFVEQEENGRPATVCRAISADKLCVLPKLHTPQNGITIRSLSHHLALCPATEVKPRWNWVNPGQHEPHGLNVLVVPWPMEVKPSHFRPAKPRTGRLRNMPDSFGFFDYQVGGGAPLKTDLLQTMIKTARQDVGPVDVIVFPELALQQDDVALLSTVIAREENPPILIGGVSIATPTGPCNSSVTLIPLRDQATNRVRVVAYQQDKHHRWMMDGSQVKQYGLGGLLDPTVNWWENSTVSQRALRFVSVQPWLTLCTLICEDLARPDPIANLVRAVGPNLVIALLMDGPQLSRRWPSRYGTVLAEDPGSSVLTVSPRGMVRLCRPRGMPASDVVALWKDAHCGEPIEISLPDKHSAVLLSLTRVWKEEFSADGRGDGESSAYLTLSGIHPIPDPKS